MWRRDWCLVIGCQIRQWGSPFTFFYPKFFFVFLLIFIPTDSRLNIWALNPLPPFLKFFFCLFCILFCAKEFASLAFTAMILVGSLYESLALPLFFCSRSELTTRKVKLNLWWYSFVNHCFCQFVTYQMQSWILI